MAKERGREIQKTTPAPMSIIPQQETINPQSVVRQVKAIQQMMKDVFVQGVHYGTIPGCPKPSLLKPGAEKICLLFRFAVDPEVDDLSTAEEIRYRIKVNLTTQQGEMFIGAGLGECSSKEEKYNWRRIICEKEFEGTDETHRKIKFATGKNGIIYENKMVRTQPADIANTILKMAKKRALIDAVLTNTAASDIFSQDLEDLDEALRDHLVTEENKGGAQASPPQRKSETASKTPVQPAKPNGKAKPIFPAQLTALKKAMESVGMKDVDMCRRCGIDTINEVTNMNDALEYARQFSKANPTPAPATKPDWILI